MENKQIQIPDGWEIKNISQISYLKKGIQFNKLDLDKEGLYPCINGGVEPSGFSSKWNTEKNTITISEGGNSCGYVNYIDKPFWLGGHCYALLELKNGINKNFLYQALKGVQDDVMDLRVGSGLPNIQQKAIKIFEIKIPKSQSEQKKIAEILSKVDTAIEQTQNLIAKYQRIKTGLMQDLLTKGIDKNGNIRSEETHEFKDSELGRIPKEWNVDSLYSLCDLIVDCKNRTSPFVDKSIYPVIRTNNIKEGKLVWKDMKFTDEKSYKIWTDRAIPKSDDVIITREAPLGQVLKIPSNLTPILGQRTMLFRTDMEKLMPDYLVFNVLTEKMQLYLNSIAGGSTVHHLKVGEMKAIQIALPANINEQKWVLNRINAQDKYISKLTAQDSKLQSIKTALMQDLLSGKKRVTSIINGEL